ncbi:hypothetical protein GF314_01720 [bacterium]|nr:hypothetical protein [bacterium]
MNLRRPYPRLALLAVAMLLTAASSVMSAELRVGPDQPYTTIQAAVDAAAAAGDTIRVDAGTYEEQVTVDGKDLAIVGAGPGSTVIAAPTALDPLFDDGTPHVAVVGVRDATVRLADLTVDGAGGGNDHERYHGILLHEAGGELANLAVTGVRDTPRSATPHGVGIAVVTDDAIARTVTIAGCVIDDFQLAGIAAVTAAGTPLDVTITGGEIQGAGPIDAIAQTGLQLTGEDLTASVDGVAVRDLVYTGLDLTATGLLVQDATGTIAGATVTGCQTGIALSAAAMTVDQSGITVPGPVGGGRGIVIDNADPNFAAAMRQDRAPSAYAPERRTGRARKATLTMTVSGNAITLDPAVDDHAGTVGLRAENVEATDDLELVATGNTFTGVEAAIVLRDSSPTSGSWLGADCSANDLVTVDVGLDSDLALLVVAEDCWWGALDGPGGDGPGSGVAVLGNVDVEPFRTDVLNLVCQPSSLAFSEVDTTASVVFDYTGGASGRIYGFSIDVSWDPSVVTATAADFALPASGPFAAADYFLPQDIAPGQVRIDVALGSFVPGAYAGHLFTADLALADGAAHEATTALAPTVLEIRDNENQALAGLVADPGTVEVDGRPVFTEVRVTDTTLGSDAWTRDGHDIMVTATVIESDLDSLRCDLAAFGGPVLELADAMVDGDTYSWQFAGITGTGDGEVSAELTAVDGDAATRAASGGITADNTAPTGPVALDVAPGHEKLNLAWDALGGDGGSPLVGLEFRYVTWGGYPAYAGDLPDAPADTAGGEDPGLGVVAASPVQWAIAPRDVYVVSAFVHDLVGNVGTAAASGAATNYWLGDHDGDGFVDVLEDLTALGDSYGRAQGEDGYDPVCDVGPTFDWSPRGVPNPQADGYQVQFEDLMVTALNHDEVDPDAKRRGATPSLRWERTEPHVWILTLDEPCPGLKGLNLRGTLPAGVGCEVIAGELLDGQPSPVFLRNIDRNGLDAGLAAMGPGAVVEGAGELLRVVTGTELAQLPVEISARDLGNNELMAGGEITGVQVPASHRLAQNAPNPFNPRTTIAFALPRAGHVQLAVYDVGGRLVRTLIDAPRPAGHHTVEWAGRDDRGRAVATGTYFYSLRTDDFRQVRKMTLVK